VSSLSGTMKWIDLLVSVSEISKTVVVFYRHKICYWSKLQLKGYNRRVKILELE
ncbi:unnamed protein product, partial [Orchesella dallaii]